MARPLIGVLALQGDVREHVRALQSADVASTLVRRPTDLDALDGIVLPGGESTTMGKLAAAFGLLAPLQSLVKEGLPAFGSCAGMIMLADELLDGRPDQQVVGGLDVVVRRNAFGRQVDSFEGPVQVAGLPGGPVDAVFIRAPWVETAGQDVQVLARLGDRVHSLTSGAGPGEAARSIVAVRQGPLLATSFHPELTGDPRIHAMFVDMVKGLR